MKIFKTIDISIQLFLLLLMAFTYFKSDGINNAIVFVVLFAAYQILSSLIHFILKFKKTAWRTAYSVAGVLVLILWLFFNSSALSFDKFLSIMLLLAPLMGLYYTILSLVETVAIYNDKGFEENIMEE